MLSHIDDVLTAKFAIVEFTGFDGESVSFNPSRRGQDMRMMIALVAIAVRRMNGDISNHTEARDKIIRKGEREGFAIFSVQFRRKRNLPFPCGDSVFSLLGGFGMVPQ